jgi:hypothetical protein
MLPNIVDEYVIPDVERIMALWRRHYGPRNRGRGLISAEAIAAERHLLLCHGQAGEGEVTDLAGKIAERRKRGRKSPH